MLPSGYAKFTTDSDKVDYHGKYVLLTSLDESDEVNVWKFYNVIRTVEDIPHPEDRPRHAPSFPQV